MRSSGPVENRMSVAVLAFLLSNALAARIQQARVAENRSNAERRGRQSGTVGETWRDLCFLMDGEERSSSWRHWSKKCKCPLGTQLRDAPDKAQSSICNRLSGRHYSDDAQVFDPFAVKDSGCSCMWWDSPPPSALTPAITPKPSPEPTPKPTPRRGACTEEDERKIKRAGAGREDKEGTFPYIMHKCAKSAYSFWSNSFDSDDFAACLKRMGLGLSLGCNTCVVSPVAYGCKNCKSECWKETCNEDCQDCVGPQKVKVAACAGFPMPGMIC